MSGLKQTYVCKCCGDPFEARVADRQRGWARFCSKTCKASEQEKRTGQYKAHKARKHAREDADDDLDVEAYHAEDPSWDAHKSSF